MKVTIPAFFLFLFVFLHISSSFFAFFRFVLTFLLVLVFIFVLLPSHWVLHRDRWRRTGRSWPFSFAMATLR